MSDLRNLTFAINIEGDENPVVKTDKAMDELVKTTGRATKELKGTSSGIKELGSNQTMHGIDKGKEKVDKFKKTLGATQKEVKALSKSMKNVGSNMNKWVTAPIVGVSIASAKLSQDLNKDMATIATMIPGQTKRLYELKDAIQDVSIDVAKDTSEIANATYGVISAYGDAADTIDKVAINAKAATAGVASTDDALNLSSAVMKAFGDTSATANKKVMDLAFGTLKLGQTSFSEIASSIGRVTPLVVELGQSQEEMFGVYAAATGVTGTAAEVSTQYAGILQALMSPTESMTELMGKMGYSSGKAMLESKGLIGTLQTITSEVAKGNGQLKDYIGSQRGQVLALTLAGELSEDYATKLQKLYNSSGMMEEAFKEQTEGINATGFSYAQSMQRLKVAGQRAGDVLAPVITTLADGLGFVTEKLSQLDPETLKLIAKIGLTAAALGPLLSIGGKTLGFIADIPAKIDVAKTAFSVLGKGMTIFKGGALAGVTKGIAFLASPVGLTTLAIGGLVAAGVALYKNWDKVSAWATKTGNKIKNDWQETKDSTVRAWNEMTQGIEKAIGKIKDGWEGLKNFVKNPIKGTINIARNIKDNATGKTKVDGSHAGGLARVPKDNYLANLHKDEEILTANDPRNQNNNKKIALPQREGKSFNILFNPNYNIEIKGNATEKEANDLVKKIDKQTRKTVQEMFYELSLQMS
ncbi:phage tail tape measure protein [Tissierella praeacuta]|uniref:phage tail tape measure protein n=1 Tax=Tissierella praeacuta TaxID=43131 RepID=UPI003DA40818